MREDIFHDGRRNAETCLKLARETNEIYARTALA
jgi:hypothetical protein